MATLVLHPEGCRQSRPEGVALSHDHRHGVAGVEAPQQRGPPEPPARLHRVVCSLPQAGVRDPSEKVLLGTTPLLRGQAAEPQPQLGSADRGLRRPV
jgi:hypothetical protein